MAKKKTTTFPFAMETRTRRTREHIIADLSVNFVEHFILESGHVADRDRTDYGYDLAMTTFDEQGNSEPGLVYFQLKATDTISNYQRSRDDYFSFPVTMRHYHLWRLEHMPVFFILYDAVRRRAYWLYTQAYFRLHAPKNPEAVSLALHIPRKNLFGKRTIGKIRQYKERILQQIKRGIYHHD